jgi:hypothetical protein
VSVVVSDTSPLHYLILCEVDAVLAQLFDRVIIPPTVFAELQRPNTPAMVQEWVRALPAWVAVQKPNALEFSSEALDALRVDPETTAPPVYLPHFEVFKISVFHRARSSSRDSPLLPGQLRA